MPEDEVAEAVEAGAGGVGAAGDDGDGLQESRDALWVGALRDEITRAGRASVSLSLLLVELDDAERLAGWLSDRLRRRKAFV